MKAIIGCLFLLLILTACTVQEETFYSINDTTTTTQTQDANGISETVEDCITDCIEEENTIPTEDFCGTSTKSSCTTNTDCKTAGCSGQVCQSVNEEEAISTCEYRDCYDETAYGLSCACVNNQCKWA